jgi:hypothetical protein
VVTRRPRTPSSVIKDALVIKIKSPERSHPVFQNQTVSDGVMYVTIGDGGNAEGHAISYSPEPPAWSAFRNGTQYGHAELSLLSPEKMQWRWMRNVDGLTVSMDDITVCNTALGKNANCV